MASRPCLDAAWIRPKCRFGAHQHGFAYFRSFRSEKPRICWLADPPMENRARKIVSRVPPLLRFEMLLARRFEIPKLCVFKEWGFENLPVGWKFAPFRVHLRIWALANVGFVGMVHVLPRAHFQFAVHPPPSSGPPVREVFGQKGRLCGQSLCFGACFYILCLIVEICASFLRPFHLLSLCATPFSRTPARICG